MTSKISKNLYKVNDKFIYFGSHKVIMYTIGNTYSILKYLWIKDISHVDDVKLNCSQFQNVIELRHHCDY